MYKNLFGAICVMFLATAAAADPASTYGGPGEDRVAADGYSSGGYELCAVAEQMAEYSKALYGQSYVVRKNDQGTYDVYLTADDGEVETCDA